MYPRLEINLLKLEENGEKMVQMCKNNGILSCFLVTKVLAGNLPTVVAIAKTGFTHLADSRMENLIRYRGIPLPKVLLRLPMKSEANRVVHYADLSLNSELSTIVALNQAAQKQNKIHGILLMFDLGDLREGIFFKDQYLPIVAEILRLSNIRLMGIGTNLTCFGGIIPDKNNLQMLVDIKNAIETQFNLCLSIVSGGNSSTVALFNQNKIPNEITNLRIGEAMFFGRETAFGTLISGMHSDAFILKAEVIEEKIKPSYPIGNIGMNSFGDRPEFTDFGMMRRGILAIGRQDIEANDLTPCNPLIHIIGASSDHLIVDLSNVEVKLGDVVEFYVNYPGLLRLMTSKYVHKSYRKA